MAVWWGLLCVPLFVSFECLALGLSFGAKYHCPVQKDLNQSNDYLSDMNMKNLPNHKSRNQSHRKRGQSKGRIDEAEKKQRPEQLMAKAQKATNSRRS